MWLKRSRPTNQRGQAPQSLVPPRRRSCGQLACLRQQPTRPRSLGLPTPNNDRVLTRAFSEVPPGIIKIFFRHWHALTQNILPSSALYSTARPTAKDIAFQHQLRHRKRLARSTFIATDRAPTAMAPVEADVFNSNRDPLFHLISAAVLVDLCLVTVLKYISKAVRTLPPAQKTRAREEQRKKNVTTYGSLAIASILILLYHWGYALLSSYEAWANEQGEPTPGALWDGWYAGTGDLDWQLGRWWQDVNPPDEFKRAALGSSRAVWWTQQLLIARLAFSAFVGIEGA